MSKGTIQLHLSAKCTLAAYNCVLVHLLSDCATGIAALIAALCYPR